MLDSQSFFGMLLGVPFVASMVIYSFSLLKERLLFRYAIPPLAIVHLLLVLEAWRGSYPTTKWFQLDGISLLFLTILSISFFAVSIFTIDFLKQFPREKYSTRFVASLALFLFFASASLSSAHMGATWIFIEGTSLSMAPLIIYYRHEHSLEGAWKYLFISSVGIAIAFTGILILAIALSGNVSKGTFFYQELQQSISKLESFWIKISFSLLLVGYTTKIGVIPFYTADIDAKDVAPSQIGALISSSVGLIGLLAVLRYYQILLPTPSGLFASHLITLTGFLSLLLATAYLLRVNNFKRMLAYSSMEHYSLILIGFGTAAPTVALLHTLGHSLTKISVFFTAGYLFRHYRTKEIQKISGLCRTQPLLGWLWLLGLFSLVGLPPFSLFFSELQLIQHLIAKDLIVLAIGVVVLLTFVIKGLGGHMLYMAFGAPMRGHLIQWTLHEKITFLIQGLCLLGVVFLGIGVLFSFDFPYGLIQRAAARNGM